VIFRSGKMVSIYSESAKKVLQSHLSGAVTGLFSAVESFFGASHHNHTPENNCFNLVIISKSQLIII
jgi:hypothetical protein